MFFDKFTINWLKKAEKQFLALDSRIRELLIKKIDLLISNPENLDVKKLKGFVDLYRISYSDYRVIFKVVWTEKLILISFIGHRRDIYKNFKD